jgi:4-alpha-glucanotransferase
MKDGSIRALALHAGLELVWTDYAGQQHEVPLDTAEHILAALDLPCSTPGDVAHSLHSLEYDEPPTLATGVVGQAVTLPKNVSGGGEAARLILENGQSTDVSFDATKSGWQTAAIDIVGYHRLETSNGNTTLAIAPPRCVTVADVAKGKRIAGLSVQTYGLRSPYDCGIGDMAGVTTLAKSAAAFHIDALAISPSHAMFTADPTHFSPYSPSSRLFYNPLLADPAVLFDSAHVARAHTTAALGLAARELEAYPLINWPESSRAKLAVFRCLYEDFAASNLKTTASDTLAEDFQSFRQKGGPALNTHALFETLQGMRLQGDSRGGDWRGWPAEWRDPHSVAVTQFAEKNQQELLFHIFLQWIADRSLAAAQAEAKRAGMRIGLISDLAVGMSGSGSHAWMSQDDILGGVEIGAPPDLFNPAGQNWGLTTFSPRGFCKNGFSPFIATLRACTRHAGGVRIDHIMGLMHLWIVPHGAKASEGAYLTYPLKDLLRLTALESARQGSVVIGEDLGTVSEGFRDELKEVGIYGMSVLWFERNGPQFMARESWPAEAVAMTSTHDLPTVAGWWRGHDLETRGKLGRLSEKERTLRATDRKELWRAIKPKSAMSNSPPEAEEAEAVVDAAVDFLAETPSQLALLPIEDALAVDEQPNLPGTIDEHPNWRRRYSGDAVMLLAHPRVARRIAILAGRSAK